MSAADDALGFRMAIDYDREKVEKGFLNESRRVLTVEVTGWPGISEIEFLDAIDDVAKELPLHAEEARKQRIEAERTPREQNGDQQDPS